jgi:hypothetical protein
MLAHGVNFLGVPPGFDCSRSVSVLARWSPPNTPQASDTVATSGFTRLPLCFKHIWWTAESGGRELAIALNQLAKRCSQYRLFLVEWGVKLLCFLFVISKIWIGVMKMKWWLKDLMNCTHENFLYYAGNNNKWLVIRSKLKTAVFSFYGDERILTGVHLCFACFSSNQRPK